MCYELVGFVEKGGCNANLGDSGQIYVVDSLSEEDLEEVIHHEWAHLLGWPGDHP